MQIMKNTNTDCGLDEIILKNWEWAWNILVLRYNPRCSCVLMPNIEDYNAMIRQIYC